MKLLWLILMFAVFVHQVQGSCKKALGMENGRIKDQQITSPSVLDKNHMPHHARKGHASTWCSATRQFSYIQVDLGREHVIRAVTIEGGGVRTLKWVTHYTISYRSDGTWKWYKEQGKLKVLKGVNRFNRHKKSVLKGVTADIIRVHPQRVGGVSHSSPTIEHACLKLELFGCPAAECRELFAPVHGRINGTSFKHPAQITFSCDVGFRLQGSSSLTCQSNGKWDFTPPTCHVVDCGKLPQPSNGQITLETSTTYNGTVRFACNLGYELNGSSVRRCQPNGKWSGVNTVCQTVLCGDPGTPKQSTRELSRGFRYRDTIRFRCFPNHVILGSALIVCQENKTWNAALPKCLAPCRYPGSPNFGQRIGDNFQHSKKVYFRCARNYVISGRSAIECRDGKWSGPTPRCMAPCGYPGKPKNGKTFGKNYRHGRIVSFSCRSEFKIYGNNNITCNNGKWSGKKPLCIARSCGHPGVPRHGKINSVAFVFPNVANYSCEKFFELKGVRSRKCQADGTWTGKTPLCLPSCGKSKALNNPMQNCRARIIGGYDTVKGEYPWQVHIKKSGRLHCSGSLISERFVVTTAHCFTDWRGRIQNEGRFEVFLGLHMLSRGNDSQVQIRRVTQIVINNNYNPVLFDSDIALLKMDRDVRITKYVRTICLPEEQRQQALLSPGRNGIVVGWGRTISLNGPFPDILKEMCIPVVRQQHCKNAYKVEGSRVTRTMFCGGVRLGGKDFCQGDSGGGYVFYDASSDKWFLGGIISWGSKFGCGLPGKYGVYVKVSEFLPWIYNNLT